MLSNDQFQHLLARYVAEAVAEMRRRVVAAGLVMTGEMLDSFRVSAQESGADFISQKISMVDYVRIRDLRSLHYERTPPLESMEYFVRSHGVHKFTYVPGYKEGTWPSEEVAARRIAWAVKMSYRREPSVRRGYRGIYSASISKAMNALKSQTAHAGALFAIRYIKKNLET